jgi:hypothetical protein
MVDYSLYNRYLDNSKYPDFDDNGIKPTPADYSSKLLNEQTI